MIKELSSPIILVSKTAGILPLIGVIDTGRAKGILESALDQCSRRKVSKLFIDLSGVPIIDTMVAQQIFQVINSLRLLGVECILSGIRPEVAQTAIQLGINFSHIQVENNLERALKQGDGSYSGQSEVLR